MWKFPLVVSMVFACHRKSDGTGAGPGEIRCAYSQQPCEAAVWACGFVPAAAGFASASA